MKRITLFTIVSLFYLGIFAQETFPSNGVKDSREGLYAFTNATIHATYNTTLKNATLLIRKGKVEAVGANIPIPDEAVVLDATDKHIYPSFIDMYADYGMPAVPPRGKMDWEKYQVVSDKDGAYSWNEAMRTEFAAHQHFEPDAKTAKEWQKIGFGIANVHQMDGISRGTSSLVMLGEERAHKMLLQERAAHHFSFKKGSSTQSYPSSLMGGIALLRQTYLDGFWYKKYGHKEEVNNSLAAWNAVQDLPQIFEVGNKFEALRAAKVAKEFGKTYILVGTGDEYQRLDAIKATGSPIVVTLDFPDAFDVEDPLEAQQIALSDLKHWELAPANAAYLAKAGIEIAFSTYHLEKKDVFWKNLRKTIRYGLSEEDALKALTHTPAKLLGATDQVGSLEQGKHANFIITSDNIFKTKTDILHHWILGKPHIFKPLNRIDLSGKYQLTVGDKQYDLSVSEKQKMNLLITDSTKTQVTHTLENDIITLLFVPQDSKQRVQLSGAVTAEGWSGIGQDTSGRSIQWAAVPIQGEKSTEDEETPEDEEEAEENDIPDNLGAITFPFVAYGWDEKPSQETVLFKNATVWTNEKEGILKNTDVLIKDGKIAKIGKNIAARNATEIDATDKHLTCGIIDEHSHIAISRGVNECTQESTAEVRIGDVIDADDIDIYRQLAGGVTTSQLLHGSCNPIGGQSALVKLRWGYAPEDMKFENAAGFIKFALGENVKRTRASKNNRFPDTRMGVEQVYIDYFTRAQEYQQRKRANDPTLRPDLELDALSEILNQKRFITCHSYVQSEINMLMHVGDQMGFTVNTFTHILEGYKVADKMAKHGAGGSSFSDWWAYKYEVIDAIPQNGEIMQRQGVTVAFNSDDAEMARRLNQEAAKAIMYGDMSEEDAWKLVTLNPAKLLHIDDRVGSIKTDKDADVVLWSHNPLSIYAKAEMTFVDGRRFFDRQKDMDLRAAVQTERNRLIQKMLAAKKAGATTKSPKGKHKHHYHCDDAADEMY